MKTSMWREQLCVLAVVAACVSERGSSAVREMATKRPPLKKTHQPGCDTKTAEMDCISNWEDLFCVLQNKAKEKGTLVIPDSPILLLIHLHKYSSNASGSYFNSYCQLSHGSEDDCAMIAVYSQSIFEDYPCALLVSLVVAAKIGHLHHWLSKSIVETSWSLPLPFCSRDMSVIIETVHQLMKFASDNSNPIDNLVHTFPAEGMKKRSTNNASILYMLIILSSPAMLLVLHWRSKWHAFHHLRSVNAVFKSLLFSTMLQSWVWFMYLYGHQFRGLSLFNEVLHSKSAVVSMAYMPFVDIGYYAIGIMGVLYLVEFPFLLWYVSTKVIGMERRGLNRRQCMLNMLKSVGCVGMVLFVQVTSWYFVCLFIMLLVYPLTAILVLGAYLIIFVFLTASTALLLLPCVARCRRFRQQSIPIMFLVIIAVICGGFTVVLAHVVEGKWNSSYNSNQIISGIFASGILALLVYTVKSVYTLYMPASDSQVGTDESDEQTLLLPEALP